MDTNSPGPFRRRRGCCCTGGFSRRRYCEKGRDPAIRAPAAKAAGTASAGFELYQNQPNPFVNKTSVGFYLPARQGSAGGPEAAEATLSIVDETGRVVYQQKGQFAKGENSIQLDRALINTTGLLYYKLETETDSATKKMIQAK